MRHRLLVLAATLWVVGYLATYLLVIRSQQSQPAWAYVVLLVAGTALLCADVVRGPSRRRTGGALVLLGLAMLLGLLSIGLLLAPAVAAVAVALATGSPPSAPVAGRRQERLRRRWDKQAGGYDGQMTFADRRFFGDTRQWVCSQASGDVLEVAIGTGLNLPHYPAGVCLTGVEWSPAMLAVARRRAGDLGREVDLRQGDAQSLDFPDQSFDTVVSTFALCAIADHHQALAEMARVLRAGGLLVLADHVEAGPWPVRALQRLLDVVSIPLSGEYWRRRPITQVQAMGLEIERHERFKLGIVERLAARKPLEPVTA